jgi:hypothetical protein
MTRRLVERNSIAVFACLVALLVLLSAYFTANRPTYMDEMGLFNPAYMVAHTGRLTYPIYGYDNLPVIVHPPIHVGLIGLLCRLGCTWYYAEGTPTAFFLLLGIWIVVRGAFPAPVKLAFLFGIGFLMTAQALPVSWFATRPEGHLHAAWFAALLMLESGRLSGWNRGRLFGGAFLLTWASSVHYYATPAVAGLAVYAVWVVVSLGWKEARPRVLALAGGAALFGLPYLAFYLVPNWHDIVAVIRQTQASGGPSSISQHFDLYRQWAGDASFPAFLRIALHSGIPLMALSTAILASVRSTRGMAIASLPLQLGVFLFAVHKQPSYLLHELALFGAALAVGTLVLADWLASRPQLPAWSRGAAMPVAAAFLCLYLATGFAAPLTAVSLTHAQAHPGDLARAAAKQILGPHARVTSRMGAWYTSGADSWHDYYHDLIGPQSHSYDAVHYLENFDAAVDYLHFSGNDSLNTEHKTLSNWYSTGLLKLRGFYFSREAGDLRLVFMSVNRPPKVIGYAGRGGALYRFDESADGGHEVITASCPSLPELEPGRFDGLYPWASIGVLNLPESNPRPPAVMVTVLTSRDAAEPAGLLRRSCVETGRVRGAVSMADPAALVASLRREDRTIGFYANLEDVPGFQGAGIPADAVPPEGMAPLEGVVSLAELEPNDRATRIERAPEIRVTTPASPGAFAAYFPLHAADKLAFPLWVRLRLRVLSGRVGLAATTESGEMVAQCRPLLPTPGPIEVALKLPEPARADDIVLFNERAGGSRVEILDAVALASPPDGLAYRRLIETSGASTALGVPASLQPPTGAVRLDSVLNLAEAQPGYKTARIEWLPRLRVTTPALPGGFGAGFPLHLAGRATSAAWVQVRLRVLSGRIGLAVNSARNGIVARSRGWLLPTAEPVDAALPVPDLSRGDTFVVFNGSVASASQAEILDIAVMVSRAPAMQRQLRGVR